MKKVKKALPYLFFMLMGGVCGVVIVRYLTAALPADLPAGRYFFLLFLFLLEMYLAIFLQIVIHESGHLLFGLLTGYRFSSFRIGNVMWIKEGGKIRLRRMSIAGTGGQCLLIPPDLKDGKCPYVLYNMGGSLMNLITAAVFGLIGFFLGDGSPLSPLFWMLAIIGVVFALMNGIPMRMGGVDNDGYNAWSLGENAEALQAFWLQMKVNEQISNGVRLKDMPEEWFAMPSEEGMQNSMIAAIAVFACNRLVDQGRFAEADAQMTELLARKSGIIGLYRNLLTVDQVYCELVGENRAERIEKLWDKDFEKFLKSMKTFPSVIRTEYTYALLYEQDRAKAEKISEKFEKVAKKYPHPNEIRAERELMDYAEGRAV
ncbi:MAG: hypothetical protein Q4F41_12860 [Eubacteriales bacterium]|nr:hypothetical protein [Eubacteriales bacterium]